MIPLGLAIYNGWLPALSSAFGSYHREGAFGRDHEVGL